VIRYKQLVRIS